MKKLLILSLLVFTSVCFAQIESFDSTYINELKQDVWGTYREIVEDNLTLTEDQATIFWPLCDAYIADLGKIFEKRVEIISNYMMNYYAMDDATAKDLLNKSIQSEQEILNTRRDYINKMLEKLPAPLVGKFFQVDVRVTALANLVRMSSVPLVREEE